MTSRETTPVVSCIVPVYNGSRFIADALRSIRAQSHPRLEIIVIDDGSTEWFIRMMFLGVTYEVLPDILVERRIHSGNLTREQPPTPQVLVAYLKLALDRCRSERR
ncbi:MAG: glycosyltransferase family 2 protein [Gemmatimonadota bacterium]